MYLASSCTPIMPPIGSRLLSYEKINKNIYFMIHFMYLYRVKKRVWKSKIFESCTLHLTSLKIYLLRIIFTIFTILEHCTTLISLLHVFVHLAKNWHGFQKCTHLKYWNHGLYIFLSQISVEVVFLCSASFCIYISSQNFSTIKINFDHMAQQNP